MVDTAERRLLEVLFEIEDILGDATSAYWSGDGGLEQIQQARDLINRTLAPFSPGKAGRGSDFHRLYNAVTAQLEHERDAAETGAERALVMRLYAAVWDATRNMKESPNV